MISEKQCSELPIIQDVLEQDWSFAHLKRSETLWGPHGYHRYPAKFIPQLVRRIIELYSEPGDQVGDLFVGSGTCGGSGNQGTLLPPSPLRTTREPFDSCRSSLSNAAVRDAVSPRIDLGYELADGSWDAAEHDFPRGLNRPRTAR